MIRTFGIATVVCLAFTALFMPGATADLRGQEGERGDFNERSLRYRTILHHDPLDKDALPRLVKLYEESDRIDELIDLYRNHLENYPDDAGAKTVLVRILKEAGRSGEDEPPAAAVP